VERGSAELTTPLGVMMRGRKSLTIGDHLGGGGVGWGWVMAMGFGKSSYTKKEFFGGRHRFEHWYDRGAGRYNPFRVLASLTLRQKVGFVWIGTSELRSIRRCWWGNR